MHGRARTRNTLRAQVELVDNNDDESTLTPVRTPCDRPFSLSSGNVLLQCRHSMIWQLGR